MCWISDEVVSEDVILKWFKDGHSQKGKSVFLEQMKGFVEWLQNAEEGKWLLIILIAWLYCIVHVSKLI